MQLVRYCWVVPTALLLTTFSVAAQPGVDARVQRLEETVRVLEQRVAMLEAQVKGRTATVLAPALDKANWRKLQKGASQDDVRRLLGEPAKVLVRATQAYWYYGELGEGQVDFDAEMRVRGWREP